MWKGMKLSRQLPEDCFIMGRRVNSKDSWTGTPMFEVGDEVTFNPPSYWEMKSGEGTVIYIFKAGYMPHSDLIKMYYQIDEKDKIWESVYKSKDVHRFVIQRKGEADFIILPETIIHTLTIRHKGIPYEEED